jgi:hypothetical protein
MMTSEHDRNVTIKWSSLHALLLLLMLLMMMVMMMTETFHHQQQMQPAASEQHQPAKLPMTCRACPCTRKETRCDRERQQWHQHLRAIDRTTMRKSLQRVCVI